MELTKIKEFDGERKEVWVLVESGNTCVRRSRYQETRICQKSVIVTTNISASKPKDTTK